MKRKSKKKVSVLPKAPPKMRYGVAKRTPSRDLMASVDSLQTWAALARVPWAPGDALFAEGRFSLPELMALFELGSATAAPDLWWRYSAKAEFVKIENMTQVYAMYSESRQGLGRPSTLSAGVQDQILEAYHRGEPVEDIAEALGVSAHAAYRVAGKRGNAIQRRFSVWARRAMAKAAEPEVGPGEPESVQEATHE